jgi:hypothetical protein
MFSDDRGQYSKCEARALIDISVGRIDWSDDPAGAAWPSLAVTNV